MGNAYISGLLYPQMKTARAGAHLKRLQAYLTAFKTDPYTISEHDDAERRLHIVTIALNRMPADVPMLIGEFAYNLRHALDHLAWQLGLLSGRTPHRSSAFPIHSADGIKDRERLMHAVWDVPCEAVEIIKSLQPHLRGKRLKSDPLWQLNKLCNLDKHSTVGYGSTDLKFTFLYRHGTDSTQPPFMHDNESNTVQVLIPLARKDDVKIKPEPPVLVIGKPVDAPGPIFELTESDIAEIHRFIRDDVLPKFARFFPNTPTFDPSMMD